MSSALVPKTTDRTRGAGNALFFMQIEMKSDGTGFQALSATNDCLGVAAGAFHQIGTMDKSPVARNADGSYTVDTTILEDDTVRMNLFNAVAPYDPMGANKPPEYIAEDGTIIVSSSGNTYDPTLPVFLFVKREANLDGKARFFYFVGQFDRASKRPNDPKNWNLKDAKINSINALSFVTSNPTDALFTTYTVTAPTLSGASVFGTVVESA